jgi:hypothetical protein
MHLIADKTKSSINSKKDGIILDIKYHIQTNMDEYPYSTLIYGPHTYNQTCTVV